MSPSYLQCIYIHIYTSIYRCLLEFVCALNIYRCTCTDMHKHTRTHTRAHIYTRCVQRISVLAEPGEEPHRQKNAWWRKESKYSLKQSICQGQQATKYASSFVHLCSHIPGVHGSVASSLRSFLEDINNILNTGEVQCSQRCRSLPHCWARLRCRTSLHPMSWRV